VTSPTGLGLHGHACWLYADEREFHSGLLDFFADGIELGQRLLYVGTGGVEKLRGDLSGLPGLDDLLGAGALRIMPLESAYGASGEGTDAIAQLAMYAAATQAALADGYRGLRVVGDVTALVLDPAHWAAHTHWECVADRFMARNPMAALCCYDRRAIADDVLADLACVHRSTNHAPAAVPFRLFAGREGLSLAGEVDSFSAPGLRRLLALATPPDSDLVVELDELEFIDHHGILAIAEHARALASDGHSLQIRGAPRSFDRLTELLEVGL